MFRRATVSDVQAVVAFEAAVMNRKLYGKPLDDDAASAEITRNTYLLLLEDDQIVATGAWRLRDDGTAHMSNIAVCPGHRRRGHGRSMLSRLLACCGDRPSVDLAVHPENEPALALYASLEFSPIRCHGNFFGDGEPRLIMVRRRAE